MRTRDHRSLSIVAFSLLALVSCGREDDEDVLGARADLGVEEALVQPNAPTISEPVRNGQIVNPADVHMETLPMTGAEAGETHVCTDYEIWTVSPSARVWITACIGGAEKLHTHLGDGVFENSHAGRRELFPTTDYLLRVRHKDSSGDPATEWSPFATRTFRTDAVLAPLPGAPTWLTKQDGFVVETVAGGFQLPVNIAFANPPLVRDAAHPFFYVTELYGKIKVVRGDLSVSDFAINLLNFDPGGAFPGSGEQGVTGIVVDPTNGNHVYAALLAAHPGPSGPHYPRVVRFTSTNGGLTASSQTVILDMIGESQGQSHQISNLSFGPDGKLYVHMGDGFDAARALDLNSFRGKVLRVNKDGTAPSDNPFFNAADGITARDYIFAYGVRNPFGGAWRAADGKHYSVENGPSVDRFSRIERGVSYGYTGSDASMRINALYNWEPAHAPVNITFIEGTRFDGSAFPTSKRDRAFVSESGPTFASGPQTLGKRIVEFSFNANGSVNPPQSFVEYNGTGKSTVSALAAGPDGLYFSELYAENNPNPVSAGARILRVRQDPNAHATGNAGTPLIAYTNTNFSGNLKTFGVGFFDASRGELNGVNDEAIGSLRVGVGFRVVVCEHGTPGRINASDLGLCRFFAPGDHANVGDLNDRISFVAVLGAPTTGTALTAFAGANFTGATQGYSTSMVDASLGEMATVGNDQVSSFRLAAGHRALVCQHDRLNRTNTGNLGVCRYFEPGNFGALGDLDNQASLIAVAGPALTAFRDPNFAGPAQGFLPGLHEALRGQMNAVGNDVMSSFRVQPGYRAVLCQHDSLNRTNTGNVGTCRFYAPGNYATMGDLDDQISMLAVFAGPAFGTTLSTFQGAGFTGTAQSFGIGMYEATRNELGAVGNDTISSIRVGGGRRVLVCENDSLNRVNTGSVSLCRFFAPGDFTTVGADLDNKISTIIVSP